MRKIKVYSVRLLQSPWSARLRTGVANVVAMVWFLVPALASAQQYTIDILIDARLQGPAEVFLNDLNASLAAEAREVVRIKREFVSGTELNAEMSDSRWANAELTILSSTALTGSTQSSAFAAFEMPFVFPDMDSVIDLQRSPVGLAGLSRMDEQGMVGLVYLNAGTTLIASSIKLDKPDDLRGKRVAISSQADRRSLELLGSQTVAMNLADRVHALNAGYIDSTVVNTGDTGDTESWALPDGGYLVTNSVQAQVGVVLAVNSNWYEVPFIYRAMIGDAAIAASKRRDQSLVESERTLRERAEAMSLSPVTFQAGHTSSAIASWIEQQPEAKRGTYVRALENLQSFNPPLPRGPAGRQRRGEAGRIYFATTREDTNHSDLRFRFDDSRTDIIKCGEINYQSGRGGLSTADIGTITADNAACGAYLNDVLQRSKRTLIFVHGFRNRFSDATERAMLLNTTVAYLVAVYSGIQQQRLGASVSRGTTG